MRINAVEKEASIKEFTHWNLRLMKKTLEFKNMNLLYDRTRASLSSQSFMHKGSSVLSFDNGGEEGA